MACRVERDANNSIVAVYAANGSKSLLYNDILNITGQLDSGSSFVVNAYKRALEKRGFSSNINVSTGNDRRKEKALELWSQVIDFSVFKDLDVNGEPKITYLFAPTIRVMMDKKNPKYDTKVISKAPLLASKKFSNEAFQQILKTYPTVTKQEVDDYYESVLTLRIAMEDDLFLEYELDDNVAFRLEYSSEQGIITSLYIGGIRYGIGTDEYKYVLDLIKENVETSKSKLLKKGVDSTLLDSLIVLPGLESNYIPKLRGREVLEIIKDNSHYPAYRYLAELLLHSSITDKHLLHIRDSEGTYFNVSRKVGLKTMSSTHAILHEYFHDYVRNIVEYEVLSGHDTSSLSEVEKEFLSSLKKIYYAAINESRSTRKKYSDSESFFKNYSYKGEYSIARGFDNQAYYGLTDITEFISEALTNSDFQAYLASQSSIGIYNEDKASSLFEELMKLIVDFFTSLSSSSNKKDISLLNDFMFIFSNLAEETILTQHLEEKKDYYIPSIKTFKSIVDIKKVQDLKNLKNMLMKIDNVEISEIVYYNVNNIDKKLSLTLKFEDGSVIDLTDQDFKMLDSKSIELINNHFFWASSVTKGTIGAVENISKSHDKFSFLTEVVTTPLIKIFKAESNDLIKRYKSTVISQYKDKSSIIEEVLSLDNSPNVKLKRTATALSSQLGININYITEDAAKSILSLYGEDLTNDRKAFFVDGNVYLIHGRSDMATLVHEVFHPMIEVIAATNPALYQGLKKQITQDMLDAAADNVVDPNNEEDVYKEAMATYVGSYARQRDMSMIDRVFLFLSKLFSKMKGSKVNINQESTLETIADSVLEGTATFNMGNYIFETDKVFFETRPDTPILSSIIERSSKIIKDEDHTKYTNTETRAEYTPVSSVVDIIANKKQYDQGIAEYLGEKYWRNLPAEFKRYTPDFPTKELTKEQFIKEKNLQLEYSIAKGKIQHLLRQSVFAKTEEQKQELLREAQLLGNKVGIPNVRDTFGWSISINTEDRSKSNLLKILELEGVNIAEELPEAVKDKLYSEVQIFSDVLGWGGTIDSIFEHFDGKFSIVDLTTGASFNRAEYNKLMMYGEQILSITDSPKNRKKLQVMLYALILKSEHPDIQFRNLKVHWIPDEHNAKNKNQDMDIDIQSFLGLLQSYLYNTNKAVYDKLIAKSPNIFNTSHYSDVGTDSLITVAEEQDKGTTLKQIIDNEQIKLATLINERDKYVAKHNTPAPYFMQNNIVMLTKSILEKKALAGMGNPLDMSRPDESMWKKLFGVFGDFADKKLQLFKQYLDEKRFLAEKEKATLKLQLETITHKLKSEYIAKRGGLGAATSMVGIDNIQYKDLYANMFVSKVVSGEMSTPVLITEQDHPDKWAVLTDTEKEFVNFISKKMAFYNKEILSRTAYYNSNNKKVTFLDLVRKTNPNFKTTDLSFFPKLPMLKEELREHYDVLSKSMASELWRRMENDLFVANKFTTEDRFGVPLKYYGNADLGDSGHWTRNLEYAFLKFTENIIDKIHMDEPLALGKGLLVTYSMDLGEDQKPRQQNNMNFLEDKLMLDILNKRDDTPVSRTGIRIPFINKRVNELALFGYLRKFVSSQIMWLKPVSGTANGAMANLITQRRAAVTTILGEGAFGLSDTAWALKEVAAMGVDYARGTLRENKLYLLMKELDYLPSNFGYNTPSDDMVTTKNKAFKASHLYLAHTFWEEQNALVILAAQLHRMKTKKGGVDVNMYDAYEVEEQVDAETGVRYKAPVYKGDVRGVVIKEGEKVELKGITSEENAKMKRVYQQMQGGYRADERTTMELYWWGQLMVQFRKYLPAIIMSAAKSKSEDYTMGSYQLKRDSQGNIIKEDGNDVYEWVAMQTEGAFRVLAGAAVGFVTNYAVFKEYSWSQLSTAQKHTLVDASLTLVTAIAMMLAFSALFPDDDDEKDETRLVLMRVLENYTQHYNPLDWLHTLQSPPAALQRSVKGIDASFQLMTALANLGLGNEDKAYTRYGRLKGMTEIYKSIPFVSSLYTFNKYIIGTKLTEDTEFGKWVADNIKLAL